MSENLPTACINWSVCDEDHVHLEFTNDAGELIFAISIDIDDYIDLTEAIDEEIESMDMKEAVEESKKETKH